FTDFREEVVGRRTKFLLKKARERAHILVGLAIAVANIDEVIAVIRKAPDPGTAREQLMTRDWPAKDVVALVELIADPRHKVSAKGTYRLSDEQARAILDLRLQRLTALGRDEIGDELKTLGAEIGDYLNILRSRARIVAIVKQELNAIKAEFGTPRRTEILEMEGEVEDEDLIQREDMVVTVSHKGYIKRVPLSAYRAQRRGGKGRSGMATRDEDYVTRIFIANTHTTALFFSSRPPPPRHGPLRYGDARRGFRHPHLHRQYPHAGAVLLLPRHGLQDDGVAGAAGGAAGAPQGAGQFSSARPTLT